ncbi:MAG TPA: RNA-binding S4 domain-containing protein [Candidatus Binatia bacterium]|nr:RNA-binding S4 domain-containing protein [Candidatus Binatia bacterium]
MEGSPPNDGAVRIDRWLLASRVFKTRSLAQEACAGGKVEVNRASASPHKLVRIGDRVRVTTPRGARDLVVRALGEKRASAAVAALLYEDVTPPAPERPELPAGADALSRVATSGRPSKRDRRRIDRWRGR